MATPSSILAWRTPWTEEPRGLQSMVSQSWTELKQLSTHASILLAGKDIQMTIKMNKYAAI